MYYPHLNSIYISINIVVGIYICIGMCEILSLHSIKNLV